MTYYIGLDLAKFKHDCFIVDSNGEVIKDSFSFPNKAEGFNTLLNVLNSLDPNQEKRIGLEATGITVLTSRYSLRKTISHIWNLIHFLSQDFQKPPRYVKPRQIR